MFIANLRRIEVENNSVVCTLSSIKNIHENTNYLNQLN